MATEDRTANQCLTGVLELVDEAATQAAGARLVANLTGGVVNLVGELGTGKTTFCRGLLRAAGHTGPVRSPTFSLVESYFLSGLEIHHFDLYRLGAPEELEFIGFRDYLGENCLCLIEWPERAAGMLPEPDLEFKFEVSGCGRSLHWCAHTPRGAVLSKGLRT